MINAVTGQAFDINDISSISVNNLNSLLICIIFALFFISGILLALAFMKGMNNHD